MKRSPAKTARALALLTVGAALLATVGADALRGRDALIVWSCGGNYEMLSEYTTVFQSETGASVRYTAAPVQYLLEMAITGPERPDVIVGRGGPGWVALERAGLLDSPPAFFAIDPLVVAVSPSAVDKVRSVEDLGEPGVRVAASPDAMRPKGKVIGLFMASVDDTVSPGIVERWESNTVAPVHCGRFGLEPVVEGDADAVLTARSVTTHPLARGKVEVVPIPPKLLLGMTTGRASFPQCAGVLGTSPRLAEARAFVAGLTDPSHHALLERHGYIPAGSAEGEPYAPMLALSIPKDMPGWQVKLAQLLAEHGATDAAIRRYWTAVNIFGPSTHDGRALCELADLLAANGRTDAARAVLEHAVDALPRELPNEFTGEAPSVSADIPGVDRMLDAHWERVALERLAALPPGASTDFEWPAVAEGDPPKNGKRTFALAECLVATGVLDDGVKDYLKVCTLSHPSRYMERAEAALDRARAERAPNPPAPGTPPMPEWTPAFEAQWQRGMTFGMRLYEEGFHLDAFKEMTKQCAGEYGTDADLAQARYRAGVAGLAMGLPEAAARQWGIAVALHGDSPWAAMAEEGLRAAGLTPPKELPKEDAPREGSPKIRLAIAEDLFLSGLQADDDTLLEYLKVLTVARPKEGEGEEMLARATCRTAQCLRARGDREAARRYLEKAAEGWPDSTWGRKAAELLESSGGAE